MSIDFDSGALPTQHEEEEYDREDYEREQELHQLLMTGLPDDMLEDSRDISSPELNYSGCSANNGGQQTWEQKGDWNDQEVSNTPRDKDSYSTEYPVHNGHNGGYNEDYERDQYQRDHMYKSEDEQVNDHGCQAESESHLNGWNQNHKEDERQYMYENKGYSFPCVEANESTVEHYVNEKRYDSDNYQLPNSYPQSGGYHGYINGNSNGQNEEFHDQLGKMPDYPQSQRDQLEHLQHFIANEHISNETVELYKVKYNPYAAAHLPRGAINPDETKDADNRFEQMQSKFLDSGESSTEAHQFAQLQILYNARGRQLEEMQHKQEECAREIRYLNHQLAMTKGEKNGLAISCQELQKLLQDAKEHEVQLEGQIKALESRVQGLSASEEETLKNQKIAEAAMDSMQQQLSELRRSESLTRTREQHENVISALKQKNEESILAMQQTLDATSIALEEQKENSKRLEELVKQLQQQQEEAKLEKAEIINGLTKSLEASQQQCRDLLQTGSMQEITQLRIQLQQVQSAKNISDNMNKALQEELADLKEQITLYESAAKIDVLIKQAPGESELPLSDSYMDLGIKNGNWKMPRFQSTMRQGGADKTLSKDEMILDLKAELERSLSSIRTKRHQVAQLQNETKESQRQIAQLKELLENTEKMARSHEVRASTLEKQLEAVGPCSSASEKALREEVERLQCKPQVLLKEIEEKQQQIEKLTGSEKQFKEANQELYNEMRQMIQDFDQDKQEAIDRCERIHQQHHEDSKCRLQQELLEQHELEKAQLTQFYKQQITQLENHLDQLNHEMSGVQECYITICKEKDSLESRLREEMSLKLKTTEQEMKKTFLEEMKECLIGLQAELEEKHKVATVAAKDQWMREKETDIKLQVERRVVLARTQWQEEQQKLKDQALLAIETEWQLRLHKTMEAIEQKTSSKKEQICQTEQAFDREVYMCQELETRLACQNVTLKQQAKEQKIMAIGETLKQLELELQKKHEDNVAKQVEIALTKARGRWLEELTGLPEYRANLQIAEKKWERKHEQDVAKQIATVLKANEEKWKKHALKEIEKAGSGVKTADLQEKILVLEREVELQKEEAAAVTKAELAKVRAQWNKEKQEEINRIHELNENDYRAFLDEHRNKLNEVLKAAKEDFTRQKKELLAQKEAELNQRLLEKQKVWSAHQEEQVNLERQQYESELVAELEHFLTEISKRFVEKSEIACSRIEKYSNLAKPTHAPIDKVKDRLQIVCTKMVEEILETIQKEDNKLDLQNALRESERQHEEYKTEKDAQIRKLELSELQLKQELEHLQHKLSNFTQQRETEYGLVSGKENLTPEYWQCGEQCSQQVQKFQQEGQQLKKKLDRMCRQLQLTVQEHKTKVQYLKEEHERTVKIMQNEKDDLVRRLKEAEATTSKTNACLQENWSSKNPCKSISTKGLEEIRHQYLRAVDKIRGDMLCYIQESKERAAEMIRAEVLRERQQTARKMRKYYLNCLHQLLADSGKNEGAEKRIMNAASKLAAMAKVLETPLLNRNRNKAETLTAHPNKKSSGQTQIISENNRETTGSVHKQTNHIEKPSSSEVRVRKFKKHRAGHELHKVCVPHSLNKVLYDATVENGTSDEELITNSKQVNVRKIEGKSGILQKDTTSMLHESKDGHQMNGAVPKAKIHKAASVAHFQNSAKHLSQISLSKARAFSSIDSLSDRAPLQMTHDQDGVPPSKGFMHYSEEYVCSKTLPRTSSDVQETPKRDEGDCVTNLEARTSCKLDTFNLRQTDGKTCHLDDCSTPIICTGSRGISMPLSATNLPHKTVSMANGIAQVPSSISSVASEISSLSDDENVCFSSKTTPVVSTIHTEQIQKVAESDLSAFNKDQLSTRTKSHKHINRTETELALNDGTAKASKPYHAKEYLHKKYPSHMISNMGVIQQDSGFDSPFLNFH
ncbi:centrosomal protein of 152 kDa [Heptranchias perlo]|uniref:centrosomal protein of 152 kDa n=1 Tax=Heptranchias perlo TaxID=212740 RepID=UPI00355A3F96